MENKEIRRLNLMYLAEKKYGREVLAQKIGYPNTNFINQMTGGFANIGDKVARKIEEKLEMPDGWMDRPCVSGWDVSDAERYYKEALQDAPTSLLASLVDEALRIIKTRNG